MVIAFIAGIFALGGASLGVLLEPLRNRFSEQARSRQARAERCELLIRACAANRSAVFRLNELYRRGQRGEHVSGTDLDDAGRSYSEARQTIREAINLIYLSGPDALVDAAEGVRAQDRALRTLRHSEDAPPTGMSIDSAPADLQRASDRYELEVQKFAKVARKHTN